MKFVDKDLKITYSSGTGPGGQHRNKVQACCTIVHVPTGMKEKCEDSRSKSQNYETAYKRLKDKVDKHFADQKKEALNKIRQNAFDETNGSKVVRTYNFKRGEVKDHRTGKTASLKKVLDGDLDLLS